jgi:hypothetical protein
MKAAQSHPSKKGGMHGKREVCLLWWGMGVDSSDLKEDSSNRELDIQEICRRILNLPSDVTPGSFEVQHEWQRVEAAGSAEQVLCVTQEAIGRVTSSAVMRGKEMWRKRKGQLERTERRRKRKKKKKTKKKKMLMTESEEKMDWVCERAGSAVRRGRWADPVTSAKISSREEAMLSPIAYVSTHSHHFLILSLSLGRSLVTTSLRAIVIHQHSPIGDQQGCHPQSSSDSDGRCCQSSQGFSVGVPFAVDEMRHSPPPPFWNTSGSAHFLHPK